MPGTRKRSRSRLQSATLVGPATSVRRDALDADHDLKGGGGAGGGAGGVAGIRMDVDTNMDDVDAEHDLKDGGGGAGGGAGIRMEIDTDMEDMDAEHDLKDGGGWAGGGAGGVASIRMDVDTNMNDVDTDQEEQEEQEEPEQMGGPPTVGTVGAALHVSIDGVNGTPAPLYKNDLFRLEDENEQPLICELASLHREAAIHFIASMKRKPDAFWLNEDVATRAAQAFSYELPPGVQTEEARHLYRNFADSIDDLEVALSLETPNKPLRLRLSRREVDIMLYSVSKGQTAMDCHYLMPYRSRRKMRKVYESIRMLISDVKEEYMANVVSTVEALIAMEGTAREEDHPQSVIEVDLI